MGFRGSRVEIPPSRLGEHQASKSIDCEALSSISPGRRWGADSLRMIDLQRSPFFEKGSDYLQLLGGAG